MRFFSGGIRAATALFVVSSGLLVHAQTQVCQRCHRAEVEHFSRSAMGNSVSVPKTEPPGAFDHTPSGGRVRIFWQDGQLQQELQQTGLTARYPAAYSVGFGNVGKSYLVEIDGRLLQSPAAFYTAKHTWAESPGFENDPVLDFWRSIDSTCLSCHTGSVAQSGSPVTLSPITCDRCHGDPSRHLRSPVPGSIVNPAKLSVRERDSVCEQCHLEGATTVLAPGKHWGEFKPGEQLDQIQTTYVLQNATGHFAAVSHVEQLALSACKRAEPSRLWCGTCHDPHAPAGDHRPQINTVCGSCHASVKLVATHKSGQTDCVSCHMPRLRAADISHAAITDHRILRKPGETPSTGAGDTRIAPWIPPPAAAASRDLGLALFNLAREKNPAGSYPDSFRLLTSTPPSTNDAPAAAALGYMLLGTGHPDSAITYFQQAVAADNARAEYWLDLAVAQQAQGDLESAKRSLQECIRRNPVDYRPYEAMIDALTYEGRQVAAADVVRQYLQVNPQSILMRSRFGNPPRIP